MKIKKLIWKDLLSNSEKSEGFIDLKAKVESLNLTFKIKNYNTYTDVKPLNNLYLKFNKDIYEFSNIDEAKEKAQLLYKEFVLKTFFE